MDRKDHWILHARGPDSAESHILRGRLRRPRGYGLGQNPLPREVLNGGGKGMEPGFYESLMRRKRLEARERTVFMNGGRTDKDLRAKMCSGGQAHRFDEE